MINTKIYKAIYGLAEGLVEADRKGDSAEFLSLYGRLEAICLDNDGTDKDHPEQWETLADFTEDLETALVIYEKARERALVINAKDHLSSIGLSMAKLQVDLGHYQAAMKNLEKARAAANKIEDKALKAEIDGFLERLSVEPEKSGL